MPSRQRQSPIVQNLMPPIPATIFCRLPQSQKPQPARTSAILDMLHNRGLCGSVRLWAQAA
jgi:hypothetical protein